MEHKKSHVRKVAKIMLLQRTELRRLAKLETLASVISYDTLIDIDTLLFSNIILKSYRLMMQREWKSLFPVIPLKAKTILDIGCGVGGINEFLFQTYQKEPKLKIYLADYDSIDEKIYYGFNSRAASYCSFDATRFYLAQAKIPKGVLQFVDLKNNGFPPGIKFDLIISLLSLGFHYPVNTYLSYILEHLSENGVVILDCRRGTNSVDTLKQHFTVTPIAESNSKRIRVKCE